jgi:hypothetical protein
MKKYLLTNDSYLYWEGQHSKAIITAHGGILYGSGNKTLDSLPFNMYFMVHENRSTTVQLLQVAYMSSSEMHTEFKGTSGVPEQLLAYYQHDTYNDIRECVDEQGFDAVTIISGKRPSLGSVIKALQNLSRYTDVYCSFCRSPVGETYKKLLPKNVMSELKQRFHK